MLVLSLPTALRITPGRRAVAVIRTVAVRPGLSDPVQVSFGGRKP
ncbi:hypothetical protein [Actinomadura sp. J1-007]|nr:hypothetical protein [Actinomadura sp. J1-007]